MAAARQPLPIDAVLPDIVAALTLRPNVVVVAPPGAGKTTRVAPAILDQPWCKGAVWLLSPRRLAARAAAERIAEEMGEPVGGSVGYATRLDSKQSKTTRLLVMTRSEEHTAELQSLMRISYADFCLKNKINKKKRAQTNT